MKSSRKYKIEIIKNMFKPVVYFLLSMFISIVFFFIAFKFLNNFYLRYYHSGNMIVLIIDTLLRFKNNTFGDSIYLFVVICFGCIIYYFIMYKQSRDFINIVNQVETMANGELNQTIEIESEGEIGNLASNINNMVTQLRNITVEERKAQQTKTDLITNVSHDLRTPLTSILGYLGLIEEDKYKDEVELRYYINIAYEKSKNLNLLINDLFELTKMQNNTINMEKVNVNLVELLSQIIEHFNYQFKVDNVEGRAKFSNDKLIVNIDANKIVRAFENLISNAIKYGKDGRYIDIETKKEGKMAVVRFINYGEQISQLDIPHLFDRFYRVEKSRNKNSGGSGLGLAITKNIIELHDGEIFVSSDEKLTVFEVRIPISE